MNRDIYVSPIGELAIFSNGRALTKIELVNNNFAACRAKTTETECEFCSDEITKSAIRQLAAYFDGKLKEFDLPVELCGKGFCLSVWENIKKIPYGKTITYGELAALSGSPKAYRSAGSCTGKNPIPIVVPCHRVVAHNGYGGFALGIETKKFLLKIEGVTL